MLIVGIVGQQKIFPPPILDGEIIYYSMDNISSQTLVDEKGNYDGTLVGSPSLSAGINGQSINLDNITKYITVADGIDLSNDGDWSASFWIRPSIRTLPSSSYSVSFSMNPLGTDALGDRLYHYPKYPDVNHSRIYSMNSAGEVIILGVNFSFLDSDWDYVTITYNRTSGTISYYINGIFYDSAVTSGSLGRNGLTIGRGKGTNLSYFSTAAAGKFDDFKFYTKELSISEIKDDMVKSIGPIPEDIYDSHLFFDFEGGISTHFFEYSRKCSARKVNSISLRDDEYLGNAISFPTTSSYVSILSDSQVLDSNDTSFTVSFWYRNDTGYYPSSTSVPVSISPVTSGSKLSRVYFYSFIANTGTERSKGMSIIAINDNNSSIYFKDVNDLSNGLWYQYTLSYDFTSGELSYYRNGTHYQTETASIPILTGKNGITLGAGKFNNGNIFGNTDNRGEISNFRVFRRRLSSAEIRSIYESERPDIFDPFLESVVSYQDFEGYTKSAYVFDLTGNRWTLENGALIETSNPIFNNKSLIVNGTSDTTIGQSCLSTPMRSDLYLSDGDFTIELFVQATTAPSGLSYIAANMGGQGDYSWSIWVSPDRVGAYISKDGSSTLGNWVNLNGGSTPITLNQPNHVALVRSGDLFSVYLNGVLQDSKAVFTGPIFNSLSDITLGSNGSRTYGFNGKIDNFRITRGIARYTSDFVPDKNNFSSYNHEFPNDPSYRLVRSLIDFEGADGSTDITDVRPIEWQTTGSVVISTTNPLDGTSSAIFSLEGDSIRADNNGHLDFGDKDFTIEMTARLDRSPGTDYLNLFNIWSTVPTDRSIRFGVSGNSGGRLYYAISANGTNATTSGAGIATFPIGESVHVALCRNESTIRIFLDGVLDGEWSITGSIYSGNADYVIGASNLDGTITQSWFGMIDNFRVTIDMSRYFSENDHKIRNFFKQ